jgi:hypothetical protein
MDDFYIIWDIKKRDWCRYDNAQDKEVRKVIMTYSKPMALAYEKMYLDRCKRKYIAVPLSLSDEAKESIINDYYTSLLAAKTVSVVGEVEASEPEGDQLDEGVEYDLFGNIVKKR